MVAKQLCCQHSGRETDVTQGNTSLRGKYKNIIMIRIIMEQQNVCCDNQTG